MRQLRTSLATILILTAQAATAQSPFSGSLLTEQSVLLPYMSVSARSASGEARTVSDAEGRFRLTIPQAQAVTGQQGGVPSTRQNQADFRIASGADSARVPFDLFGNNILVRIRINGSRYVWFVFDSGASVNVINERAAKSLGLTTTGTSTLDALGGTARGSFVEGVTISISGVEVSNQRVVSVPLDALSEYSGRDVQGLIGNNFIQNFVVEIDYHNRTLTFHDPKTYNLSGAGDALELENRGGNPFVKAELSPDGRAKITDWFEIDTGSSGTFSVNRPFAEKQRLLELIPKTKMAEGAGGAGVGGETKSIETRVASVTLGRYKLDKPVISISQDAEGYGESADAGFIGTDLLRRFTVTLDYRARRMLLRPNADFGEPFEVNMSGLELVTKADDFKVVKIKHVRAGSPAAQAGLREGDEVVAVDGRPASKYGLDMLAKMFRREGKEYGLTVRRGEQVLKVKIRLRRLV
jgi:predicted aspartyl protease